MSVMAAIRILLQATTAMGILAAGFFWFNWSMIKARDQDESLQDLQTMARLHSYAALLSFRIPS
jgi:hypothetical protein